MKLSRLYLLLILGFPGAQPASAWDETGHQLTADIAMEVLDDQLAGTLIDILSRHPRFAIDFTAAMPETISEGTLRQQRAWLLGRAAFWPDLARQFPQAERDRYNRPAWHFIDGNLVGREAEIQGNVYVGVRPLRDRQLFAAATVRRESRVAHIISALDYNSSLYTASSSSDAERAIALCWILHLIGDLHQPLHTGALFTTSIHRTGDRGGNNTPTDRGTLHARWDRAASSSPYAETLESVQALLPQYAAVATNYPDQDWTVWLQESREILAGPLVYSALLRAAVVDAESAGTSLTPVTLPADYTANMAAIAQQRLAQAGLRIAAWLTDNTRP